MSMNLTQAYADFLPLVEAEMKALIKCDGGAVQGHYDVMRYHMGWLDAERRPAHAATGKRIRPLLCMLACMAVGGLPETVVPAAAGLELLHNFSLIHDDIEDNSPTRRHRATAWTLFGMPLACNSGDGMFSLAHSAFYRLAEPGGVDVRVVVDALRRFSETCLALTEGQFLDMSFEQSLTVTVDDYFRMISAKTGALLAVAPEIGAMVGGAAPSDVAHYRSYGAALGRAFQLQDDLLGIWGDEARTGKSSASDILSKKKSLPVVYGLADPDVGKALAARYAGPPFTPADVPVVLGLLERAGARAFTQNQVMIATGQAHQALAELAGSAEPGALAALGEIVDALAVRQS